MDASTPIATATLQLNRWQLQLVLDGLWDQEHRLRGQGMDGSDPRLVELIELRSKVEKQLAVLRRYG